ALIVYASRIESSHVRAIATLRFTCTVRPNGSGTGANRLAARDGVSHAAAPASSTSTQARDARGCGRDLRDAGAADVLGRTRAVCASRQSHTWRCARCAVEASSPGQDLGHAQHAARAYRRRLPALAEVTRRSCAPFQAWMA